NRYAYCFYNPLKYVDPTGERCYGPSCVDLTRMFDDWVMEQKRAAFQMGLTMVESHFEEASFFANLLFSKGDEVSGGSNHDNSGIAKKNENGEMIPDTSGVPAAGHKQDKDLNSSYNTNPIADYNDECIRERIYEIFGANEGNIISKITTRSSGEWVVNPQGNFMNSDTGKVVPAYCGVYRDDSGNWNIELHISQNYCNVDDVEFLAVVGHELIHAYHSYIFGPTNVVNCQTEYVAYNYQYNVYSQNYRFHEALNVFMQGSQKGYWGNCNFLYTIPYNLKYIKW
ncbi:MAG: hypothetical protein MJZ90_11545, partial [Bacteroidales bacterium]|nr:hypothetical protein [Bacteroidales bacterium]